MWLVLCCGVLLWLEVETMGGDHGRSRHRVVVVLISLLFLVLLWLVCLMLVFWAVVSGCCSCRRSLLAISLLLLLRDGRESESRQLGPRQVVGYG